MDEVTENLAVKIRKLQALQQSPYKAEAMSAKRKIQNLLNKNGITLDELGLTSTHSVVIPTEHNENSGPWQERVLHILTRNTGIRVFCSKGEERKSYSIEGKESAVLIIQSLYQSLEKRIMILSRDFEPCISDLESFRQGIIESIEPKLQELLQTLRAIYAANSNRQKPTKKQKLDIDQAEEWDDWYSREENSFHLGRAIGRKTPVNFVLDSEASYFE